MIQFVDIWTESVTMDLSEDLTLLNKVRYWVWSLQIALQISLYFLIGMWIRKVISPIDQSVMVANRIAAGDLSSNIVIHSRDEIGRQLEAMNTMQDSLRSIVSEIKQLVEAAAVRGDFSVKIALSGKAGYIRELSELLDSLSNISETGLKDVTRVATALANGDLSQKIIKD